MNKIFCIFFISLLFLNISNALYENQIGINDWARKNLGDLKNVHFLPDQILFESHDQVIGLLTLKTGMFDFLMTVLISINRKY